MLPDTPRNVGVYGKERRQPRQSGGGKFPAIPKYSEIDATPAGAAERKPDTSTNQTLAAQIP